MIGLATKRLAPFALVACPLVWLLGPLLVRDESLVYRDAAHFYYPLFEWTTHEWAAGRIPLWNPQENCGVPVLGEATSSVFYPGKLLFALPWLSFAARYKLYIVGHVALAAGAAYFAARRWGASQPAAAACAVSYACGGCVLFGIYNVVFLVSAAWLPLSLVSAETMLAERSWKQAICFGAILALMTLGGDPQTAYHAGLLAVLYAWILRRAEWRAWRKSVEPKATEPTARSLFLWNLVVRSRLLLLGAAAVVGALLAAVQILPALEWNRGSDRAAYDDPRSVYESVAFLNTRAAREGRRKSIDTAVRAAPEIGKGMLGPPQAGTHHEAIYDFSVGPWRWAEFLWPNFSGRPFPDNHRWINAIPAEGNAWVPSLYAGLLPLLLGLGSIRWWGSTPRDRWLSWTLGLSVLASLGWFGLGWIALEVRGAFTAAGPNGFPVGAPTGGLYWLCVVLLPGYAQFRYPAKWLVPAAFALALLAARGWDKAFAKRPARLRAALVVCGAISLLGIVVALALRPWWASLVSIAPDDNYFDYFGPLNVAGSWRDLAGAFSQTAVLCGAFWWLLGRRTCVHQARWSWIAAGLTAAEIAFAQSGLIAAAPNKVWTTPSPFAAVMARQDAHDGTNRSRVYRSWSNDFGPPQPQPGQGNRQIASAHWERATLYPKYHLLEGEPGVSLVESSATMQSNVLAIFMHTQRQRGNKGPDDVGEPRLAALSFLSAEYLILPKGFEYAGCERLAEQEGCVLWRNPSVKPRAWIADCVLQGRPGSNVSRRGSALYRLPSFVLDRSAVFVSADIPASADPAAGNTGFLALQPGESTCNIVTDGPQRVEIEVSLERPGLVVLGDLHYPGWKAEVENKPSGRRRMAQVVRCNSFMRGVFLPAGEHRVTFTYRPTSFYRGATISGVAWLAVTVIFIACIFARR